MYTLEQLESKTFGELKKIGYELNVRPEGDRRCRQTWIDAIVGVNPPLLQLLEVSPVASVKQVQEAIKVQEPPITKVVNILKLKSPDLLSGIAWHFFNQSPEWLKEVLWPRIWDESEDIDFVKMIIRSFCGNRLLGCNFDNIFEIFQRVLAGQEEILASELARNEKRQARKLKIEAQDPIQFQRQESIEQVPKTSPGVETDFVQEAIEQVAKISPGVESVQEPIKVQATEPITEAAKTSPGVEVDRALSHKFLLCLKEGHNTLWYDGKNFVCEKWSAKTYCKRGVGSAKHQLRCHPEVKRLGNLQVVENSPADHKPIEVQATEPIEPAAKTSPGAEVDRVQHPIIEMVETFPAAEVEQAQEAIVPAAKNRPGSRSKTSTAHQLLELFKSSAHIIEDSPSVQTEATVSESAIAEAVKTPPGVDLVDDELPGCCHCCGDGYIEDEFGFIKFCQCEPELDQNPILTGITFSDRFLTRYAPPQSEIIHFQPDAEGQLSLLNFDIESVNEPPDPDDFDSMFAFWAAYDAWEASDDNSEPSSIDKLPSSIDKLLEVSLDSFCEWAPCPEEWYEPESLPLKASSMLKLSPPAIECSVTSTNFTIPTFDAWCDRANRQTDTDEPPDTGIFARSPKPKPPKFSPPSESQPQEVDQTSRSYPEAIPKLFHRVVAGSSNQPARSPPGGDAMS